MSETQYYTIIAVPLVGILMNALAKFTDKMLIQKRDR
jgi:hypothetical protein